MGKPKVIVVMPAYNAEKAIEKSYREIPKGFVDNFPCKNKKMHSLFFLHFFLRG